MACDGARSGGGCRGRKGLRSGCHSRAFPGVAGAARRGYSSRSTYRSPRANARHPVASGGVMLSDPLFEPSAGMSRRDFLARSLTAGVGLAAANLTWETLAARDAGAASAADLPELTKFLSRDQVADLLKTALAAGGEFAEVYGEYTINTGIRLDEMKVKSVDYNILSGVGI